MKGWKVNTQSFLNSYRNQDKFSPQLLSLNAKFGFRVLTLIQRQYCN